MQKEKVNHSSFWSNLFKGKLHTSEIEQILSSLPPFSDLSKKDIQMLCRLLHNRNYIAGEYIFYQGDPGIGLYLIQSGDVEISRIDDLGNNHSLAMLTKGDFLGELALVDGEKRPASAIARTDVKLSVLFKPDLDSFVEKYPKKGIKILKGLSFITISRLRTLNDDYFNLLKEFNREKIHGTEY